MNNFHSGRGLHRYLLLTSFCALYSLTATADVRQHPDYIAIDIEAEDFNPEAYDGEDERWTLTDATTPQTEQDPDGNNSDGAVGKQYLELLPDVRVSHDDPFGPPTALWGDPGIGPTLEYTVDFPEAGRYYVHVRANSSGTEDNGIHVGLNDSWPVSGRRWQSCSRGQGWVWSSRQRYSGGAGACGTSYTIWLDVEDAGVNTVKFSAREDGFEFDRFVLIKDKSDNTRVCRAVGEGEISCADGFIETTDDITDVAVKLSVDRMAGIQNDLFEFNAAVSNEDRFDRANQIVLEAELDLVDTWEFVTASDACTLTGTLLNCALNSLNPTGPGYEKNISFILRAVSEGEHTISTTVSTVSVDQVSDNDIDSLSLSVEKLITYTSLESVITRSPATPSVDEKSTLLLSLENTGDAHSENTVVSFDLPAEFNQESVPDNCVLENDLVCELGILEAGATKEVSLDVIVDTVGLYLVSTNIASDNLEEGSMSSTFTLEVRPAVVVVVDPEPPVVVEPPITTTPPDITDSQEPTDQSTTPTGSGKEKPDLVVVDSQKSGGVASLNWLLLMLLCAVALLRTRPSVRI